MRAGEQATSSARLEGSHTERNRVEPEFCEIPGPAGRLAVLQKQFAAIPGPGLRYSSDLLPLFRITPWCMRRFRISRTPSAKPAGSSRTGCSRVRRCADWWKQQQKGNGPKLEDVLDQVKTFSSYLGDEIVFAVAKEGTTYTAPVVLARVRRPGLETFLQKESKRLNSNRSQAALQTVRDPWAVTPAAGPSAAGLCQQRSVDRQSGSGRTAAVAASWSSRAAAASSPERRSISRSSNSYQQGVEWLFSADMEQIVAQNVQTGSNRHDLPPGIGTCDI